MHGPKPEFPLETAGCIQVDAEMRIQRQIRPPQLAGCVAMSLGTEARRKSPCILNSADTIRFTERANRFGALKQSGVGTGSNSAAAGNHAKMRAHSAIIDKVACGPRAWRIHYGNAHVNRCAPPGRNTGGGPQGKPD
jgi:hypothetical protein